MNRLSRLLVVSRLARHRGELALILIAISVASCLVVWVIGGYNNLFTEVVHTDNRPLGRYDLVLGADSPPGGTRRGAGGGFGGPLAKRRTQGGGGMQAPSGSGRGESAEKPARKRFDPLAPARGADGVIVLDRLPEEIPPHMRKRLRDADVDGSGTLSRVEEETLYDEVFVPKEEEREEKPGREKNSSDSGRNGWAAPGGGRPGDR